MAGLQFLKLGGSLITDKQNPHTARQDVIDRLAQEIAAARRAQPDLRLILGHGSGSFGHVSARKYGTRQGVNSPQGWRGFVEVWWDASSLNRLVMEALVDAGVPALAFSPAASVLARRGQVAAWDLRPIERALAAGILPVVYGDVIFDLELGGTILSTEDLFAHLAQSFRPQRLLLAGIEPGVWADYPHCKRLLSLITPVTYSEIEASLFGSAAADVTGGMATKVRQGLDLVERFPGLDVYIFSGEQPGAIEGALLGANAGTRLAFSD